MGGADEIKVYGPEDLDEEFKLRNKHILSQKRLGGYAVWKPYIILKAIENIQYGDYCMYLDSGAYYIRSLKYLVDQIEKDGTDMLFSSSLLPEKHWSKRDAFILMDCDVPEIVESHQYESTFLFFKKTERSVKFIKDWLMYMEDERLSTDIPNTCGLENYEGYREHRHDQTVMSLLAKKYGYIGYKSISDSSEYRKLVRFKDGQYYGYSRDEILEMAKYEWNYIGYRMSKYKRIIISTRMRDEAIVLWLLRFTKCTLRAIIRTDIIGRMLETPYKKKYMK